MVGRHIRRTLTETLQVQKPFSQIEAREISASAAAGFESKTPYRDGTTHVAFEPLDSSPGWRLLFRSRGCISPGSTRVRAPRHLAGAGDAVQAWPARQQASGQNTRRASRRHNLGPLDPLTDRAIFGGALPDGPRFSRVDSPEKWFILPIRGRLNMPPRMRVPDSARWPRRYRVRVVSISQRVAERV